MSYDPYFGFNLDQKKTLERLLASDDPALATLASQVGNLNAWATALATKLNADTGVNDTNYDTTPQAGA